MYFARGLRFGGGWGGLGSNLGVGGRALVCVVGRFLPKWCRVSGVSFFFFACHFGDGGVLTVLCDGFCGRTAYPGCWCGLGSVAGSADGVLVPVLRCSLLVLLGLCLLGRC